jgi:hypothetical protein
MGLCTQKRQDILYRGAHLVGSERSGQETHLYQIVLIVMFGRKRLKYILNMKSEWMFWSRRELVMRDVEAVVRPLFLSAFKCCAGQKL